MREIYRQFWRLMVQMTPIYLLLVVLLEVLDRVFPTTGAHNTATGIGLIYMAFYLHRHILTGEPISLWRSKPRPLTLPGTARQRYVRPKAGRFLFTTILIIFGTVLLTIPALPMLVSHNGGRGGELKFLAVAEAVYLVILSVFGTALPAAAMHEPGGFRLTLRRARRTFWMIFGGLILGPGLVTLLAIALLFAMVVGWELLPALHVAPWAAPLAMLASGALRFIGLTSMTMAVVVLCRAYRHVATAPEVITPDAPPSGMAPQIPA
jgi:hypothetical protein